MTASSNTNEGTIGEIRMAAFNIDPTGWHFCAGQLLSISDNTALYAIIGNCYGGVAHTSFALPDLRGRVPIGVNTSGTPSSSSCILGQKGGVEQVLLSIGNLSAHTHKVTSVHASMKTAMPCSDQPFGNTSDPYNAYPGTATAMYSRRTADTAMATCLVRVTDVTTSVADSGSSQPHNNMQPFLVLNFIICSEGNFPSRS